jgi:hypothetical protein
VWGLAFAPDETWLVTGCFDDDRFRIGDLATARVRREIPLPGAKFRALTLSPDGARVATTWQGPEDIKHRLTVYDPRRWHHENCTKRAGPE